MERTKHRQNESCGGHTNIDRTHKLLTIKNGDAVRIFIVQVAAVSWATAEVPEITAAIQSFLKAGFRSAAQVEFVAIIGDEDRHSLERRHGSWVSGILFVTHFLSAIVGRRPKPW